MNTRLPAALSALFVVACLGGCGVSTERPSAESTELTEAIVVEVDDLSSDDTTPVSHAAPSVVRPSCVPLETRSCRRYTTRREGTVTVTSCIASVETCKGNGQTWTACGEPVQVPIDLQ